MSSSTSIHYLSQYVSDTKAIAYYSSNTPVYTSDTLLSDIKNTSNLFNSTLNIPYIDFVSGSNIIAKETEADYYYYAFTNTSANASNLITFTSNVICDVLIVGGGGGGVAGLGGGSSGGLVYAKGVNIPAGKYPITVGAGGSNANGSNSSAFGITVYGGMKPTSYIGATKYLENDVSSNSIIIKNVKYPRQNMSGNTITYTVDDYEVIVNTKSSSIYQGTWLHSRVFDGVKSGNNQVWISATNPYLNGQYPSDGAYYVKSDYRGEYIMIDMGEDVIINQMKIWRNTVERNIPQRHPRNYRLYGSNNATDFTSVQSENWVQIFDKVDTTAGTTPTNNPIDDNFTNTISYRYYALVINNVYATSGSEYVEIYELELFGYSPQETFVKNSGALAGGTSNLYYENVKSLIRPYNNITNVYGTISQNDNNNYYYSFTDTSENARNSIQFYNNTLCDVLIVGGGGSGAVGLGGGSSGGLIYSSNVIIPPGNYPIIVGAGGSNTNGSNSSAFGAIAFGGMQATGLEGASKYLDNSLQSFYNSTTDMIAWYKFDGNGNDSSGNNNNLIYSSLDPSTGAVITALTPLYNPVDYNTSRNSFYNDITTISSRWETTNAIAYTPDITISMWLKINDENANFYDVVLHSLSGNLKYHSGNDIVGNTVAGIVLNGDGTTYYSSNTVFTADSNWHFHVLTGKKNTDNTINVDLYYDNVLTQSWLNRPYSNTASKISVMGYTSLGASITTINSINSKGFGMIGNISDLRIYNRVLNDSEINVLYKQKLYENDITSSVLTTYNKNSLALGGGSNIILNYNLQVRKYPPTALTGGNITNLSITQKPIGPPSYGIGDYTISWTSQRPNDFFPNLLFNGVTNDTGGHWSDTVTYSSGTYSGSNNINGYYGEWIKIILPVSIYISYVTIYPTPGLAIRSPKNFKIFGSNNGTTWTEIISVSDATYPSDASFTTLNSHIVNNANNISYSQYILVVNIIVGNGGLLNFAELELYGYESLIFQSSSAGGGINTIGNSINNTIIDNIMNNAQAISGGEALIPRQVDNNVEYYYYTFTDSTIAEKTIQFANDTICDVLIIGGGGSGGGNIGGGGGAGGVVYIINKTFNANVNYKIVVGGGGIGNGSDNRGNNGGDSYIYTLNELNQIVNETFDGFNLIGRGGGGGGTYYNNISRVQGKNGGSGGGSGENYSPTIVYATSSSTQGNTYYNKVSNTYIPGGYDGVPATSGRWYGSGGGGASQSYTTTGTNVNGRDGIQNDITGNNIYYAAGGGAGYNNGGTVGLGGQGGGGNGGANVFANYGLDGTGSGGGGSREIAPRVAGNGGSGIVIIRFKPVSSSNGGEGFSVSIRNQFELFAGGGGANGGTRVPSENTIGYGGNSSELSLTPGGDGIVIIRVKPEYNYNISTFYTSGGGGGVGSSGQASFMQNKGGDGFPVSIRNSYELFAGGGGANGSVIYPSSVFYTGYGGNSSYSRGEKGGDGIVIVSIPISKSYGEVYNINTTSNIPTASIDISSGFISDPSYYYYEFTDTTKTNYITFNNTAICDVLIVGGGGSGAIGLGGGSSGGLLYSSNVIIPPGEYPITVGAGGINGNGGASTAFGATVYGGMKATTVNGATKYLENEITGSLISTFNKNSGALAGGNSNYNYNFTNFSPYNTVITATGAIAQQVTGNPGYYYYTFTSNANGNTGSIQFTKDTKCDILVVGGGGSGAIVYGSRWHGGGGGGGAVVSLKNVLIQSNTNLNITVGKGGIPNISKIGTVNETGTNGDTTSITSTNGINIFAAGGEGGTNSVGGGAGQNDISLSSTYPYSGDIYVNAGGYLPLRYPSSTRKPDGSGVWAGTAGGGGAGAPGETRTPAGTAAFDLFWASERGGDGGDGKYIDIISDEDALIYDNNYWGGGGGGGRGIISGVRYLTPGTGGKGGGATPFITPAKANTGGGGGGIEGTNDNNLLYGTGASGIVIIRVPALISEYAQNILTIPSGGGGVNTIGDSVNTVVAISGGVEMLPMQVLDNTDYYYYAFTNTGSDNSITFTKDTECDVLIVGGGGGGGSDNAGGGGAGGLVFLENISLRGNVAINVGTGGAGGIFNGNLAESGTDSSIIFEETYIAKGGGGGGSGQSNAVSHSGTDGGSGGGSAYEGFDGSPGTSIQDEYTLNGVRRGWGFVGGDGKPVAGAQGAGGGGGGASEAGINGNSGKGGRGGDGKYEVNGKDFKTFFGITDTSIGDHRDGKVYFAGGGGAGNDNSTNSIDLSDGSGYNNRGGFGGGGGGRYNNGNTTESGVPNTGGGGGGSTYFETGYNNGARGGSGIVIIRFRKVISESLQDGGQGFPVSIRRPNELFAGGGGANGGKRINIAGYTVGYGGNSSSTTAEDGGDGIVIVRFPKEIEENRSVFYLDKITDKTSNIINSNLTPNKVVITDNYGIINTANNASLTEFEYLSGVKYNIANQFIDTSNYALLLSSNVNSNIQITSNAITKNLVIINSNLIITSNSLISNLNALSLERFNVVTDTRKVIVNNVYDSDLIINGSLTVNSNLTVAGSSSEIFASVFNTETLEINTPISLPGPLLKINYTGTSNMVELYSSNIIKSVITNNGFLGIGNTTPQYSVTVTSNINITGKYKINGTNLGYNNISNIPFEFNPSLHNHVINDITDLQNQLDNKQNNIPNLTSSGDTITINSDINITTGNNYTINNSLIGESGKVIAIGADILNIANTTYEYASYTSTTLEKSFTPLIDIFCDILIVGGGGGGGGSGINGRGSGGGGGGEVKYLERHFIPANTPVYITVGDGGNGGLGSVPTNGSNGFASYISYGSTTITSYGGGGGAKGQTLTNTIGLNGASGGGGVGDNTVNPVTGAGGNSILNLISGFSGGFGGVSNHGGGGGGYGGVGLNASSVGGGDGGTGIVNSITGIELQYAGGGGGGAFSETGTLKGGSYSYRSGSGGGYESLIDLSVSTNGNDAIVNSGSGGGGATSSGATTYANGGNGGSGIVIIRWDASSYVPSKSYVWDKMTTTQPIINSYNFYNETSNLLVWYKFDQAPSSNLTLTNYGIGDGTSPSVYDGNIVMNGISGETISQKNEFYQDTSNYNWSTSMGTTSENYISVNNTQSLLSNILSSNYSISFWKTSYDVSVDYSVYARNDATIPTTDDDNLLVRIQTPSSDNIIYYDNGNAVTTHNRLLSNNHYYSFLLPGLYQYKYSGYMSNNTNYFIDKTPIEKKITLNPNIPTFSVVNSYEWIGYFRAPTTGAYKFYTYSDDASFMWIGNSAISGYSLNNLHADNRNLHGLKTSNTPNSVALIAGIYYPIRMQFGGNAGSNAFSMYYKLNGGSNTVMTGNIFYNRLEYTNNDFIKYIGYKRHYTFTRQILGNNEILSSYMNGKLLTSSSYTFAFAPTIVGTTAVAITGTTYMYAAFTTVGSANSITFSQDTLCDILVVGGGGQGGRTDAGGGGAGGLVFIPNLILSSGTYNITVGKGGNATQSNASGTLGENGASSTISFSDGTNIITALGGGGGGAGYNNPSDGSAGGSGGGAGSSSTASAAALTFGIGIQKTDVSLNDNSKIYGFGNNGGENNETSGNRGGGGGGGAGGTGYDQTSSSNPCVGGIGLSEVTISGTTYDFKTVFGLPNDNSKGGEYVSLENKIYFAGGGGGGHYTSTTVGGLGGGGVGYSGGTAGTAGLSNSGGGGGGGGGSSSLGGNGGSGVVIIRWSTTSYSQPVTISPQAKLYIGLNKDDTYAFKNKSIGDFRIYNKIITTSEMGYLYNVGWKNTITNIPKQINDYTNYYSFTQTVGQMNGLIKYPRQAMSANTLAYTDGSGVIVNLKVSSEHNTTDHSRWSSFNGLTNDVGWCSSVGKYTSGVGIVENVFGYKGEWLMIDLGEVIMIDSFKIYQRTVSAPRMPKKFRFYASNDINCYNNVNHFSWNLIYDDTGSYPTSYAIRNCIIGSTKPYRYFFIVVNENYNDGYVQFAELEIYGFPANTFKTNTITFQEDTVCDVLVIGGGGSGGVRYGGGGGAGACIYMQNYIFPSGTYNIVVGDGGASVSNSVADIGNHGEDSYIQKDGVDIFRAIGGGGGGYDRTNDILPGGSSGGTVVSNTLENISTLNVPISSDTYGNKGGVGLRNIYAFYAGGGGGGAGSSGKNAVTHSTTSGYGGAGGEGRLINITGRDLYYAAGGGGGIGPNGIGGQGGSGIGGNGSVLQATALNGLANTGSGGGGSGFASGTNLNGVSGAGGSGIVIIRWKKFVNSTHVVNKDINVYNNNIVIGKTKYLDNFKQFGLIRKYPPIGSTFTSTGGSFSELSSTIEGQLYGNGKYLSSQSSSGGYLSQFLFDGVLGSDTGIHSANNRYSQPNGNVTTNGAILNNTNYIGEWVKIKMPIQIYLAYIKIYARNNILSRAPGIYRVYGSNDDENWTLLIDNNKEAIYECILNDNILFSNSFNSKLNQSDKYYYFALCVNKIFGGDTNATQVNFSELEFYGSESYTKVDMISNYDFYNDTSDMKVWYKLNDLIDSSGNGLALTTVGSTIIDTTAGNYMTGSGALKVVTTGDYMYVNSPSDYYFAPNSSFSVSAWIKLGDTIAKNSFILNCRKGNTGGWVLNRKTNSNEINFETTNNSVWTLSGYYDIGKTWTHVSVTFEYESTTQQNVSLYINGVFKECKSGNIYNFAVDGQLCLGNWGNSTGQESSPNTFIDDFRMYNRILTFEEIHILYNVKTPIYTSVPISTIDSTNLQLRYDFDDDNLVLNKGLLGTSYNLIQNNTQTANGAVDINNSYLSMTPSLDYSTWTEATIAFNVKRTALNTAFDVITYQTSGSGFIIQRSNTNNFWAINMFGSGSITTSGILEDFVPDNIWNHYVFTFKKEFDKVRTTIYKNGNVNPVFTILSGTWTGSSSSVILSYTATTATLKGFLDDFRIYDKALLPYEASQLYTLNKISNKNASINISDYLVGWYKFENNALDSSAYGNHLSGGSGTKKFSTNSVTGQYSADFDGSTNYSITSINLTGTDFTICFWAYRRITSVTSYVLGNGSGQALRQSLHIGFRNDTKLYMAFYSDDCNSISGWNDFNEWHHYSYTYNTEKRVRIFYRDGIEVSVSGCVAGGTPVFNTMFNVGSGGFQNERYNGLVDDLRIYKCLLTAEEIAEIATKPESKTSLNTSITSYIANTSNSLIVSSGNIVTYNGDIKTNTGNINANNLLINENLYINSSIYDYSSNIMTKYPRYPLTDNIATYSNNTTIALYSSTEYNFYNDVSDMIAWYKFENNWLDSSLNGYHLTTVTGTPILNKTIYKTGTCAGDFNGVTFTQSSINLNGTSFTVCFWLYRRTTGSTTYIMQGTANALRQRLHLGYRSSGSIMFAFYADDTDSKGDYIDLNTWVHLSYTYDYITNRRKTYRNGVELYTSGSYSGGKPAFGTGTFRIGNGYNFIMDDLRIYRRTLSENEIRIICNNIPTSYKAFDNTKTLSYTSTWNNNDLYAELNIGNGGQYVYSPSTSLSYTKIVQNNDIIISNGTTTVTVNSKTITIPAGYQIWTVPYTATYKLIAGGARGMYKTAITEDGKGIVVTNNILLTAGDKIIICIGKTPTSSEGYMYSGGGGTFISKLTGNGINNAFTTIENHSLLLVAGGGGGAGSAASNNTGMNAVLSTNGTYSRGISSGIVASNGGGGGAGDTAGGNASNGTTYTTTLCGAGGGGFIGNGGDGKENVAVTQPANTGGKSFINGGQGGLTTTNVANRNTSGGFGGGGGSWGAGGGGGGYSGGNASVIVSSVGAGGGGGGSYDINGIYNIATQYTTWDTNIPIPPQFSSGWSIGNGFVTVATKTNIGWDCTCISATLNTGVVIQNDVRVGPTQIPYTKIIKENDIALSSGTELTVTVNAKSISIPVGYQIWTVPYTKTYKFIVAGAMGANNASYSGGYGAVISNSVSLVEGDKIIICVGRVSYGNRGNLMYGGGGGTFVSKLTGSGSDSLFSNVNNHTLLFAAGGGGGAGNIASTTAIGINGSITTSGTNANGYNVGVASSGGGGGGGGTAGGVGTNGTNANVSGSQNGGGGGGYIYDGGTNTGAGGGGGGGKSFLNKGIGGNSATTIEYQYCSGGFGGGGGSWNAGGGGGGYSGGNAAVSTSKTGGGGGGSYDINGVNNNATQYTAWNLNTPEIPSQYLAGGWCAGDGFVTISLEDTTGLTSIANYVPNYTGEYLNIDMGEYILPKNLVITPVSSALTKAPKNFRIYGAQNMTKIIHNGFPAIPKIVPGTTDNYFAFTSTSGINSISFTENTICDILMVGGGGAGSGQHGGGGGAGRLILFDQITIPPGIYYINVGDGGKCVGLGGAGNKGGDTEFLQGNTLLCYAEGGGGSGRSDGLQNGGSGAGGDAWNGSVAIANGTATFLNTNIIADPTIVGATIQSITINDISYKYAAFTTVGSGNSIQFSTSTICDVFMIGGGGGGGYNHGGGGGAGAYYLGTITFNNSLYNITVGSSGNGGTSSAHPQNGGDTFIQQSSVDVVINGLSLRCKGGGGAGMWNVYINGTIGGGKDGGCGGGGDGWSGSTTTNLVISEGITNNYGTVGSGFVGGKGRQFYSFNKELAGGGGGGIGGAGNDSIGREGGNGGNGLVIKIKGTEEVYGGGGGASEWPSYAAAPGGLGGGAILSDGTTVIVGGSATRTEGASGSAGTVNTGSGGGGGKGGSGGAGGTGIVIIRWRPITKYTQPIFSQLGLEYGNDGSVSSGAPGHGGGGGGAGTVGTATSGGANANTGSAGNGGDGLYIINGINLNNRFLLSVNNLGVQDGLTGNYYLAGGGGGGKWGTPVGGGLGGKGGGGYGGGSDGNGIYGREPGYNGRDAIANTGSGGGGGGDYSTNIGGSGGSGLFVIRWKKTFQQKYSFYPGIGGNGATGSYRGGGGAGGIIVKYDNIDISPGISGINGQGANGGGGGFGGKGFGAGGGGGGLWYGVRNLDGGSGSSGFAYILTPYEEYFISTTQNITLLYDTDYIFIFGIGGGGGGGIVTNNSGGGSGYIQQIKLNKFISNGTNIDIIVGAGGGGDSNSNNGSSTIITIVLTNEDNIVYTIEGGKKGTTSANGGDGAAIGGRNYQNTIALQKGGMISSSILTTINNAFNDISFINDYTLLLDNTTTSSIVPTTAISYPIITTSAFRYFMIVVNSNWENTLGTAISELEIIGNEKYAYTKYPRQPMASNTLTYTDGSGVTVSVTGSTTIGNQYDYSKSFDNIISLVGDGWASAATKYTASTGLAITTYRTGYAGEYIMIDLGEQITLNNIKIYPRTDGGYQYRTPKEFKIFASNSSTSYGTGNQNTGWTDIYTGYSSVSGTQLTPYLYVIGSTTPYRYYMIVVNKIFINSVSTLVQIVELELYGTPFNLNPAIIKFPREDMSENTKLYTNGGTLVKCRVSSELNSGYSGYRLFDNSSYSDPSRWVSLGAAYQTSGANQGLIASGASSKYFNTDTAYYGEYVIIDLGEKIILNTYKISPFNSYTKRSPKDFRIYATNNDVGYYNTTITDWVKIDEQTDITGWTDNTSKEFILNPKPIAYRYYAMIVNRLQSDNDGYLDISEWELYGQEIKNYIPTVSSSKWKVSHQENFKGDLEFKSSINSENTWITRSAISATAAGGYTNFTGIHHCKASSNYLYDNKYIGRIVSSTKKYSSINSVYGDDNIKRNLDKKEWDCLPIVELSSKQNDKNVFGIITKIEDNHSKQREYQTGYMIHYYDKELFDRRLHIAGVGEGGIWVCDYNGGNSNNSIIESGDYITSSLIPGFGMKQHDDLQHNYTVAKATMDCDFNPKLLSVKVIATSNIIIEKPVIQNIILDASNNVIDIIDLSEDIITSNYTSNISSDKKCIFDLYNINEISFSSNTSINYISNINYDININNTSNIICNTDFYNSSNYNIIYNNIDIVTINNTNTEKTLESNIKNTLNDNEYYTVYKKDENGEYVYTDLLDEYGNIVYEYEYELSYVNIAGEFINKDEYNSSITSNIQVYKAAFIGCSYHSS